METPTALPVFRADTVVDLGRIALAFGRVDRITYHDDGQTRESDTDHTVMLGLVGCALAARFYPGLDVGLVAQYALVHDLVEVYAGDTPTLRIDADGRAAKKARELAALVWLGNELDPELPWVTETIAEYERQRRPEARFVKALDKILPMVRNRLCPHLT